MTYHLGVVAHHSLKAGNVLSSARRQEHWWKPWYPPFTGSSTGRLDTFLLLDSCNDTIWKGIHFQDLGGRWEGCFLQSKKKSQDNNTIYVCSVAHPTYFARRHRKITELFLTYWATQKWFLTHPRFTCKAKNDISSTCASVSHMSNSFLG